MLRRPAISDRSLVLGLSQVPNHLRDVPIEDARWKAWAQNTLGTSVEVTRVRAERTLGVRGPKGGGRLIVQLTQASPSRVEDALSVARASGQVAAAEADPIWYLPNEVAATTQASGQWHLEKIGAPQAWATSTGAGVVVAVLDSGVDYGHPDLRDAIWTNSHEIPDNGVDDDNNGYIDDVHGWNFVEDNADPQDASGHGTHVAGIIGARGQGNDGIVGVAPGVSLMVLRTGAFESEVASSTAEAIRYAVDNGARIINMSYGGGEPYSGLRDAIDYATSHGVLLVAAAQNNAASTYVYPAVEQEVIAVASLDPEDRRSEFSNFGRWIDLAAPGEGILSTFPNGATHSLDGTSQAAPIVAGVAALVAAAHPEFNARQIRKQLLATVVGVDAHNPDDLGLLGAGRVSAIDAVGPAATGLRAYLAGVQASEVRGNGDQEIGAGENASVTISLHVTSGVGLAEADLISADPWVTVTSGRLQLQTHDDRTASATFGVLVNAGAPADHLASLSLVVRNGPTFGVNLPVAPQWRRIQQLPFACSQNMLLRPDGSQVLVADVKRQAVDTPVQGLASVGPVLFGGASCSSESRGHVYASFRGTDGSFTPTHVLSDLAGSAECPAALVAPNGDIHVTYHHRVTITPGCAQIFYPGYTRYDAATGQWSTPELLTQRSLLSPDPESPNNRTVSVALDAEGLLHVAWSTYGQLTAARRMPSGEWRYDLDLPLPGRAYLQAKLLNTAGVLRLFVRDASLTAPVSVLEYDNASAAWSAPVQIAGVTAEERAMLPFSIGNGIYRAYAPIADGSFDLARLSGASWGSVSVLSPDVGASGFEGFTAAPLNSTGSSLVSLISRRVQHGRGTEVVLLRSAGSTSSSSLVPSDRKLLATAPEIGIGRNGELHAMYGQTIGYSLVSSGYTTEASVTAAALPRVPVVVDDGMTTRYNRTLHASWSSTHPSGIGSYRFAWGTVPGADDIAPWQETSQTETTVDLGTRRLLPGQTVYVSVQARSNAVLSSAVGTSDGITVVDPVLGDVNGDGQIAVTDALAIAQRSTGLDPIPFFPEVADVNCDGTINIVDAQIVGQYSAGLITKFPCP